MSAGATWPAVFTNLLAGTDLTTAESSWAMDQIMSGIATPAQVAGFLVALRAKGESIAELTGLADQMLAHAVPLTVPGRRTDLVGTGGDLARTVNISTMASIVAAGAAVPIVKHGNRAASSASGSADVLEALGIRLEQTVARVEEIFGEVGITFCFAPMFHPSMRFAAVARRELGVGTAFNFLGPLTNPARVTAAAIGCADLRMAPIIAGVLAGRGTSALVFRGEDGLDELTTTAPSRVWHVEDGNITEYTIDWTKVFGVPAATLDEIRGAEPDHNAAVARGVLAGESGPIREAVLLNAAAAAVADATLPGTTSADGDLFDRMSAARDLAAVAIDSGAAADLLQQWIAASNRT